jgi:phosphatidylglycerol:prolipoprotein diacylglycerol transferase
VTFPVDFHLFGRVVPSHAVMEIAGYAGGFQLFLWLRRRQPQLRQPTDKMLWMIVGAVFGALIGSKLLAWVESPAEYFPHWRDPQIWLGGKTIVGGLLGGWIGVEIAKKALGIRAATGDLYVFPLIFGMAVGRVGCFLTGLPDHTYGSFSSLPWAVDFGDGPRHPTQLYDIVFLILLGVAVAARMRKPHANGRLFRLFMLAYLLDRFCVEFIKPTDRRYLGLSAIQCACLIGAIVCLRLLWRQGRDDGELKGDLPLRRGGR